MAWSDIDPLVRAAIVPLDDELGKIMLTPQVAGILLASPAVNRNLVKSQVARFKRHLRAGTFRNLTGQSILLDYSGRLAGGQHRATAVLESGIPVLLYVRWNQDVEKIQAENEGGIPWSAPALAGGGKNSLLRASITRSLIVADLVGGVAGTVGVGPEKTPGKLEVAALVNDARVLRATDVAEKMRKGAVGCVPSGIGMAYALIEDSGLGDYPTFFEQVHSGEGLFSGDPAYTLRRTFLGRHFSMVRSNWQTAYVTARAWIAFYHEEKIHHIYMYDTSRDAIKNCTPLTLPGQKPFFATKEIM